VKPHSRFMSAMRSRYAFSAALPHDIVVPVLA